jgi:hypothetical protein
MFAMLRRRVDVVMDSLGKSMKKLDKSIFGIPVRSGSFRKQYDNLAKSVGVLTAELHSVRGVIK